MPHLTLHGPSFEKQLDGRVSLDLERTLFENWIPNKLPFLQNSYLQAWAIGQNRNKIATDKKFPSNPTDIIYIAMSILPKWRPLLKEKDRVR